MPTDAPLAKLLEAVDDLQHGSMCARNVYEDGECDCHLEPLDGLAAAVREAMGRDLLPELQRTYQRAIDDATMAFVDDEHEAHALALRAVERRVKAELMGGNDER